MAALIALVGCKDKPDTSRSEDKDSEMTGTVPDLTDPEAKDAAPARPAEPAMLNKMKMCPSAIAGAHTTIAKAGTTGVAAVVIGKDKLATDAIRERAKHVAEVGARRASEPVHDGTGGGGGFGKCSSHAPTAQVAAVAVEEIENGAKITFELTAADEVGPVFEVMTARAKDLNARGGRPEGSGGGRAGGGGHGGHGSRGQGGK